MKSYLWSSSLVAIVFLICFSEFPPVEANNGGFTVNLIHRDSPQSPFYNPNSSHFERLKNAFERSLERSSKFASNLMATGGSYLIKIGYGTPPVVSFAIVDTGSELTWTQCLPCINCYPSKFPPFEPRSSSTFRALVCEWIPLNVSKNCQQLSPKNVSHMPMNGSLCTYELRYGDNSYTRGNLVKDTITLTSRSQKVSFGNFIFGCGHDNVGTYSQLMSGIIGLTNREKSLVSQLSPFIRGKFSFCLAPFRQFSKPAGKLSFGDEADVFGPDVVSTPLYSGIHYNLNLRGVTVGTQMLKVTDQHFPSNGLRKLGGGNIIIDSGTTLTLFPTGLYTHFEEMLRGQIRLRPLPYPGKPFTLCYPTRGFYYVPKVTLHFLGADVKLKTANIFMRTSPSSVCLAIVPSIDFAIFGNIAQTNYLVGYDIVRKRVSFKPTDCNRY